MKMNKKAKRRKGKEKKIKEKGGRETINISGGNFSNKHDRLDLVSLEHKASLTTIYNSTYDIYGLILSVMEASYQLKYICVIPC